MDQALQAENRQLKAQLAELQAELELLRKKDPKVVDKELRQSRAEFNALLSNLAAGIAMIGTDGIIRQVNDKFANMVGRPPGEIIGRPLMDLTYREDIDHSMDRITALSQGAMDSYSVEKRYLRADGSWFWAEACVTGVWDDEGKLEGLIGVILDITERKQVEDALRRSQGYLEAMFTHMASGVALVDRDGRIVRHNTKCADMLGYGPGELTGLTLEDITYPEDRSRTTQSLGKIINDQVQCYTIEKRYQRKDGSHFWAEASVTQIFGPDGQAQEYVGVITDIDQRKRAEHKLQEAYESEANISRTDTLTGLGNRKRYNESVQEMWRRCRSRASSCELPQPLALIMMDIDHFKQVNDTHGHPAGDTCLEALAEVLGAQIRDDVFCRVGGEEFAILLEGSSEEEAVVVAERLRRVMEGHQIVHRNPDRSRLDLGITISLGVAAIDGLDSQASPEILFAAADQALYRAKQGGRNQVSRQSPR